MGMIKNRHSRDLKRKKIVRRTGKIHRRTAQKKILMTQITTMV